MQEVIKRPDLKPSPKDSVMDAKARAEEIRKHLGGVDDNTDDFYVAADSIPDGWTYEWKRHTVLGQEDPSYQVQIARMGWRPVPSARHPEMMPSNNKSDVILRKGMILMERPQEITDEVRDIDRKRAREQVRVKEAQLNEAPAGQFERKDGKGSPTAKIKKDYSPVEIPKD